MWKISKSRAWVVNFTICIIIVGGECNCSQVLYVYLGVILSCIWKTLQSSAWVVISQVMLLQWTQIIAGVAATKQHMTDSWFSTTILPRNSNPKLCVKDVTKRGMYGTLHNELDHDDPRQLHSKIDSLLDSCYLLKMIVWIIDHPNHQNFCEGQSSCIHMLK